MPRKPPAPESTLFPLHAGLDELAQSAKDCKACDLWKLGTQTVFGEGTPSAKVMLVGEQPGNQEDLEGKPFVGPAGKLLDAALLDAGIDRKKVYVTNAVKHFKWEPRGKRRIHKKPNAAEIVACRPWLDGEIAALQPQGDCVPGGYRRAGFAWARVSRDAASRGIREVAAGAVCDGDGASFLHIAGAGRRDAA